MASPLKVQLEQYEGPLDLLLDLIRKQQIDIYDIPIARITAQYLEYLQKAAELDIELGADFIYMAATLIHIKSKMLLPRDPALAEIEGELEDPRQELVQRLLEHERFRNAAEMLQQKLLIEESVWSNPQIQAFLDEENGQEIAVTLFDLVRTFQQVLERAKHRPVYEVAGEEVSVPEMMMHLKRLLEGLKPGESISALELFEQQKSRRAMVALFLAILELVRMQAIILVQKELFGDIGLRRHKRFEEAFQNPLMWDAIDKDYQ